MAMSGGSGSSGLEDKMEEDTVLRKFVADAVSLISSLEPIESYFPEEHDKRRLTVRRLLATAAELGVSDIVDHYEGPDDHDEEVGEDENEYDGEFDEEESIYEPVQYGQGHVDDDEEEEDDYKDQEEYDTVDQSCGNSAGEELSFEAISRVCNRSSVLEMKTKLLENMTIWPKKKRVCLHDFVLFVYPMKSSNEPELIVELRDAEVRMASGKKTFEITLAKHKNRKHVFRASHEAECQAWVSALDDASRGIAPGQVDEHVEDGYDMGDDVDEEDNYQIMDDEAEETYEEGESDEEEQVYAVPRNSRPVSSGESPSIGAGAMLPPPLPFRNASPNPPPQLPPKMRLRERRSSREERRSNASRSPSTSTSSTLSSRSSSSVKSETETQSRENRKETKNEEEKEYAIADDSADEDEDALPEQAPQEQPLSPTKAPPPPPPPKIPTVSEKELKPVKRRVSIVSASSSGLSVAPSGLEEDFQVELKQEMKKFQLTRRLSEKIAESSTIIKERPKPPKEETELERLMRKRREKQEKGAAKVPPEKCEDGSNKEKIANTIEATPLASTLPTLTSTSSLGGEMSKNVVMPRGPRPTVPKKKPILPDSARARPQVGKKSAIYDVPKNPQHNQEATAIAQKQWRQNQPKPTNLTTDVKLNADHVRKLINMRHQNQNSDSDAAEDWSD